MNELFLLAINLTRRCNLACSHCYLDAKTLCDGSDEELTTAEVEDVLDAVASRCDGTMVVLTGGEPLVRRDLEDIISFGSQRKLAMVVGTNGTLLTERRVLGLKKAGLLGVGISVDSLDATFHDEFRGKPGAWKRTMAGIDNCRRQQLPFQIHFSVTESNAVELPRIIDFCRANGARVLNVFFLVCTGRGEAYSGISAELYERILHELIAAQKNITDLIIRPRCAPHYKRIAYQQNPDSLITRVSGRDGDGCIAGIHYCRITPEGGVTACPYIEEEQGNVRDGSFLDIWDHATAFEQLREPSLNGKCGICEFSRLCGGCRARPVAMGGNLMDEDPICIHTTAGDQLVIPFSDLDIHGIAWTPEAEQRLSRVPQFLQRLVRQRAEAYLTEIGERLVKPQHLAALAARRFGDAGPPGSIASGLLND